MIIGNESDAEKCGNTQVTGNSADEYCAAGKLCLQVS